MTIPAPVHLHAVVIDLFHRRHTFGTIHHRLFCYGLALPFLFRFVRFGILAAVDGSERAQMEAGPLPLLLHSLLGFIREARPWYRLQAGLADGFAGHLTDPVFASMDALNGCLDFGQGVLIGRQQAQRKIPVEAIGP